MMRPMEGPAPANSLQLVMAHFWAGYAYTHVLLFNILFMFQVEKGMTNLQDIDEYCRASEYTLKNLSFVECQTPINAIYAEGLIDITWSYIIFGIYCICIYIYILSDPWSYVNCLNYQVILILLPYQFSLFVFN